jgi:hypothetical protein
MKIFFVNERWYCGEGTKTRGIGYHTDLVLIFAGLEFFSIPTMIYDNNIHYKYFSILI